MLTLLTAIACGYVIVQTEPAFRESWSGGQSLASRAGIETTGDFVIGLIGLVLVFEATRRSIGWIVPAIAMFFVLHSLYNHLSFRYEWPLMPDWMLPHAGQSLKDIVSTTFLQTLGVFGPAASGDVSLRVPVRRVRRVPGDVGGPPPSSSASPSACSGEARAARPRSRFWGAG